MHARVYLMIHPAKLVQTFSGGKLAMTEENSH